MVVLFDAVLSNLQVQVTIYWYQMFFLMS